MGLQGDVGKQINEDVLPVRRPDILADEGRQKAGHASLAGRLRSIRGHREHADHCRERGVRSCSSGQNVRLRVGHWVGVRPRAAEPDHRTYEGEVERHTSLQTFHVELRAPYE